MGVLGVRHLSELRETRGEGVRARLRAEGGVGKPSGVQDAHPVVVARLLQAGAEDEAAAGHARVLGTLDVPGWAGRSRSEPVRASPAQPPKTRGPYDLARVWTSGLVLSTTTRFFCLRAASQAATQRCQVPRVS